MGFERVRPGRDDDDGFSLVETIMALLVLGTILVITITVISTAFRTLGDAKETDVANNIGQARIEAIRSLDFTDVGVSGGTPAGTINETEDVEVQGVDLRVFTEVEWVGSTSGLNIVPGGGDGVPGFGNSGIDYKLVTVTVTPNTGDPIVFETIVSPPNVTATEGVSNIIVEIEKVTPDWASEDPSFPRVYLHEAFSSLAGPLDQPEPPFSNVTPGVEYDVRLGPDAADTVTPDGAWAMQNPALTPVSVGVSSTTTKLLFVYRPITLEITAQDILGTPLPDASVVVTEVSTGNSETFDNTFAGFDAATATWTIDQLAGGPIQHGDFEYVVSAPDHVTSGVVLVEDAPENYPDVVQRTTVDLEPVPVTTTEVTITVTDTNGVPLNEATVTVTPAVDPPYDLVTDETGTLPPVELDDAELFNLDVSSAYGHEAVEIMGFATSDAAAGAYEVALATPTDQSLFILKHDTGAPFDGVYQYRAVGTGGPDDWFEALPNLDGTASVVVGPHTGHPNSRWEARVFCDGATSGGDSQFRNFPAPRERERTFDDDCTGT
ncbi:MAG: type II secretion system protein [Actinomycetota bacterium]